MSLTHSPDLYIINYISFKDSCEEILNQYLNINIQLTWKHYYVLITK